MNKHIFSRTWTFVMLIAVLAFSGCSDDDSEGSNGMIASSGVCTKWGASKSEVMDYMRNYEMNSMENGFICYNGKNDIQTISYQFEDEELRASLVLIPEESISPEELKTSFKGYEYLGEKNNLDIYISESANTMVTAGKKVNGGNTYFAVGYVKLSDEE